jgi:beta-xylosidase
MSKPIRHIRQGTTLFFALVALAPRFAAAVSDADGTVYLFTSFRNNGEDGLKFLYSDDGYRWQNIPGTFLKPAVGPSRLMRDPSLARGPDGTFHLVWTTGWKVDQGFGYANSRDLVQWSPQRFIPVMQHEPTTVNVWAPELFYDPPNDRFIICWASTIPGRFPDHLEPHDNNQRMYYTVTRDFQKFEPTKLFFDPDFSVIDCTIVKDRDRYVLVLKDNTRPQRNLRVAFGNSPLGPWRDISAPFTQQFTEGPSVLKLGDEWMIYYDAYQESYYGAAKTKDFKTFRNATGEVSFPEGHKHGTVLSVSRRHLERLLSAGSQ